MKKLITATLCILAACAAINIAVIGAASYGGEEPSYNRTYIIKEYEGKVACFEENSEKPFLVTETLVKNLPPVDRKMLRGGVEVVGAKSLSRALEDYRS